MALDLLSFFNSKQHFLLSTPFYCLNFTANKRKNDVIELEDVQHFTNGFFRDVTSIDPTALKTLTGGKKVICVTTPTTLFLYRTKLDSKLRNQGIKALVPILKDRFNIDLSQNKVGVLDAEKGIEVDEKMGLLPENICIIGAQKKELKSIQDELAANQFIMQKLGFSSLLLPQGIASYQKMLHMEKPVLVLDFLIQRSCVYVVGRGQILAAYPPTHGLKNLLTLGRKELNLQDDITTLRYLTKEITRHDDQMEMLLSRLLSDVKSFVNFFEIQTNESIENIFVAGLPNELFWIEVFLSKSLEIPQFAIDYEEWMKHEKIVMPQQKIPPKALFGMMNALIHYKI